MAKFLAALFNSNNRTVEGHLVFSFMAVIALIVLAGWHVIALHNPFDASSFGQGVGATLAGTGAAAWGQGKQNKDAPANE